MASKREPPVLRAPAAREPDRFGELIGPENIPPHKTVQVSRLVRVFGLTRPTAGALAEMAYDSGRLR